MNTIVYPCYFHCSRQYGFLQLNNPENSTKKALVARVLKIIQCFFFKYVNFLIYRQYSI